MASLFDATAREAILERIGRLTPDRKPLWGRFSAPEMVCHVGCGLRQGLGEPETGPPSWPPSRVFGRISGRSWGVLQHKHLDHHLRQFGV